MALPVNIPPVCHADYHLHPVHFVLFNIQQFVILAHVDHCKLSYTIHVVHILYCCELPVSLQDNMLVTIILANTIATNCCELPVSLQDNMLATIILANTIAMNCCELPVSLQDNMLATIILANTIAMNCCELP